MSKVSILMPAFNQASVLPKAIESVLVQTFGDWELLILDDASTDETPSVAEVFYRKDKRIRYIRNEQNLGLVKTLNRGLSITAQSKYVARLDSEDFWISKEKLEKQINFLDQNPDCALIGTATNFLDVKGNTLFTQFYPQTDDQIKNQLLFRNCFAHSSVVFRADFVKSLGGYDENKKYIEDYDLWLKLGTRWQLANLPHVMTAYLVNPEGITKKRNNEQIESIIKLIKQYKRAYPGYVRAWLKWRIQSINSLRFLIHIFKRKFFSLSLSIFSYLVS